MKREFAMLSVSAMLSLLLSCTKERINGNGPVITEARAVNNFTAISASGSTPVYINKGPVFKVEVKGYSNLLPYYETKLVNNTLQLGYRDYVNVKNDNTEVFITMPGLNGLSLFGSGSINTTGAFTGTTEFNASISGSGSISIGAGDVQRFFSSIAGSGNIYALGFVADKAETTTQGSGNTEIAVNSQLKVKIAGSGNVYYRGNPLITTDISGSGAVIPK